MEWINGVVGLFLLTMGRRLFWLFVACIGFAAGFNYAQYSMATPSFAMMLLAGFALGLAGALLAVFLESAAIALGGFLAGAHITASLFQSFVFPPPEHLWLFMLAGGILAAILLFAVFGWALIVLSSLVGAALLVQLPMLGPVLKPVLFVGLTLLGLFLQGRMKLKKAPPDKP